MNFFPSILLQERKESHRGNNFYIAPTFINPLKPPNKDTAVELKKYRFRFLYKS
jgi:hypothetical protein